MDIRGKVLAGIIAIILAFLLILITVSSSFMLSNYEDLEASRITEYLDLVTGKINARAAELSDIGRIWADSDAMYAFAEGKNPGFIGQSLTPNTFQRYNINAIIITNTSGSVLYSKGYDFTGMMSDPVPTSVFSSLSSPHCPHMDPSLGGYAGFINVPEKGGPALFASAPILHSNHEGSPAGMLIIGKYLTADELEQYRSGIIPSLSITHVQPGTTPVQTDGRPMEPLVRSEVIVTRPNVSVVTGSAFLSDHFGDRTVQITVGMPRTIALQGKNALLSAIMIELITGLVIGLFIILVLDKLVLSRLQGISTDIATISSSGNFSGRIRITSNDEISRVKNALNAMLARVEEAQIHIHESESKLLRAETVAKFGHWEIDMATQQISISPGVRAIFGIGDGEFSLDDFRNLPLPGYQDDLRTALEDLVAGTKPYNVEFPLRRPADNAVVIIHSIAEYDPVRHVAFGVIQDITRQKEAERGLKESEERYRSLTDNLPELVLVHRNGIFLYANETLARAVGIPADELLGRSIFEFVAPESRAGVIEKSRQRVQGMEIEPFETVFQDKNNEKHHGFVNAARITFRGEPASLVIIIDISARKAMEVALSTSNTKLQMLASITRHDIRNKILGMRSYIAIAMMSAHDDTERKLFGELEDMARTIDEQIEFTREYQTMGMYTPQWLTIQEISSRVAGQLNMGGISVRDRTFGLMIFADPLLEKVFYNLFDNAIRYGERLSEILIQTEQQGDDLLLIIEDNGIGIPAEDKCDIFERGFGKNTGLGLFMIREILSITGITIRETGIYGKGARFELLVPKGAYRFPSGGTDGKNPE